jgi:hypothetical protein
MLPAALTPLNTAHILAEGSLLCSRKKVRSAEAAAPSRGPICWSGPAMAAGMGASALASLACSRAATSGAMRRWQSLRAAACRQLNPDGPETRAWCSSCLARLVFPASRARINPNEEGTSGALADRVCTMVRQPACLCPSRDKDGQQRGSPLGLCQVEVQKSVKGKLSFGANSKATVRRRQKGYVFS